MRVETKRRCKDLNQMNDNLNETSIQNALNFQAQQTSAESTTKLCQLKIVLNTVLKNTHNTFMHLKNEDSQTHLNVKTKFGYNT